MGQISSGTATAIAMVYNQLLPEIVVGHLVQLSKFL